MDDLISRQQAIDALDCINGVEEVLRSLPPAQPEPHWIPCSERLPEEMGTYMTTIDYGKYGRVAGQRYYHGALGWEDDCVVAWMPLPEPYRKGAKD